MSKYCKLCKELHMDNEMCPYHLQQLKQNPSLLTEAANFTSVSSQYHLVTSQTLDEVARGINKVAGTKLSFEGTHQYMRDIQVFKQLNVDGYSKSGVFENAKTAKSYLDNATQGQLDTLTKKLNGTGQEIDWLRWKNGQFRSLIEKSKLLGEEMTNAPGVDGITLNRFDGKTISRTTIKAAESKKGLGTNVNDILKALKNRTLNPTDTVAGIEGTDEALHKALTRNIEKASQNGDIDYATRLKEARAHLKIQELNHTEGVKQSTNRLKDKIMKGQGHSTVTFQEVSKKTCQGAVIGAAVGLTVSSVTHYLKYKNGEISEKEAFQEVGRDTLKGALVGGAIATVSVFLPGGILGFIAGIAVGMYINKTLTNLLDEVFGKGSYAEILHASGYVYGMTISLADIIKRIEKDEIKIQTNENKSKAKSRKTNQNLNEFEFLMKGKI